MKKIGLVLDNPKRDLYGVLLMAHQFAHRGEQVYIVPYYHQVFDVPLLGLHALITNFVRAANIDLLNTLKRMNTLTAVMDTEGGVLSSDGVDSPKNWAKHLKEEHLINGVDVYFTWGKTVANAFAEFSGMNPNQIQQTGCPRYDLCSPKWRPFIEFGDNDYVLINTNYSAINPKFTHSFQDEIEAFVHAGWDREYAKTLINNMRGVWNGFLETCENLFQELPNQTFLIRPHPFESAKIYQDRFAKYKNVRIDGSGNVFNMIANCRLVLHLNCGTSIETLMLGKLPVSLEYLNNPIQAKHTPLPSKVSYHANSFAELVEIIRDPAPAQAKFKGNEIYNQFIEPFFGVRDGQAATRIVDRIESELSQRTKRPKRSFLETLRACSNNWDPKRVIQGALSLAVGSHQTEKVRARLNPKRLEKHLSLETAQNLLEKLGELDGSAKKLRVRRARHPLTGAGLESLVIELDR